MEKPTINNEWITLDTQRNGLTVQRKFAGLDTVILEDDTVDYCKVSYYERELYTNGEVNKLFIKTYELQDLSETVNDTEGWRMEELAVLTGFINNLGYNGIINPARLTLANTTILGVNVPNGYPLHRDTREKKPL